VNRRASVITGVWLRQRSFSPRDVSHRIADSGITVRVRHPSYGGQTEFLVRMSELYRPRLRRRRGDLFGPR
jgi:hypothetical protein